MMLSDSQVQIITDACNGDKDAEDFCRMFVEWVHWIDDVVDKDKLWLPKETIAVNLNAIRQFSVNPFFQRFKIQITPLIIQSFRAFADSTKWEQRESIQDRRAADIFKSTYHEVIWHVAYLTGGWDHMTKVTEHYRHFDYDFKG